jgi:hypothetical protein
LRPASVRARHKPGWSRLRQEGELDRAEPIGQTAGRGIGTVAQPEAGPGCGAGSGDAGGEQCPRGREWPGGGVRNDRSVRVARLTERARGRRQPPRGGCHGRAQYHPSLQGRLLLPSQGDRRPRAGRGEP